MNNLLYAKVIAIDGPCGSGKSTIAKKVAELMNIVYVDTGAMFRSIGLVASRRGVDFFDTDSMVTFLQGISFCYAKDRNTLVEIDGENLTKSIREHHVSLLASKVSAIPVVRDYLLSYQKKLGHETFCVMEGRDIGTVVFPDSFCKIFLTASEEVRAQRRYDELLSLGDNGHSFLQVLEDVKKRDHADSTRAVAPLKKASDAFLLDTSNMGIETVYSTIIEQAKLKAKSLGWKV